MNFLFRADAGPTIGLGHVMRCLALAEALTAAGHAGHFALHQGGAAVFQRLAAAGLAATMLASDAVDEVIDLARRIDAAGIVLDHYTLSADWRSSLRAAGLPVLSFADAGALPPHADLVLDASRPPDAIPGHLFGARYVLLRRDLADAGRSPPLPIEERGTILVTFGGSDPAGLTLAVADALAAAAHPPLDVVVGGGVIGAGALAGRLSDLGPGIRVHRDVVRMAPLMRRAGLAVSAGGGTLGELAALAVPTLVVTVADNQVEGARLAEAQGWAEMVDARSAAAVETAFRLAERARSLWADIPLRSLRAAIARSAVDPGGADRVAAALITACRSGI